MRGGSTASEYSVNYMEVGAYNDYNFGCGATKSAVFKTNSKKYDVGIAFGNLQIQPVGVHRADGTVKFSHLTHDCVGTFSAGTWMGIIVVLLLLGILSFAFLMLNSVQTIDRFDDPKRRQIVINAKE